MLQGYKFRKMLKIALITIYLLFSSSIVKSDSKINITVKESTDFTGKEFKRSEQGCGLQKNQKGNRDEESVLNIFNLKNSKIKGLSLIHI